MTECPLCGNPMDDYASKCSWCLDLDDDSINPDFLVKKRIIELGKEFTQEEISEVLGLNRTVIFHDSSEISLKSVNKIIQRTGLKYEELSSLKLEEWIRKNIYAKRYVEHITLADFYHNKLGKIKMKMI